MFPLALFSDRPSYMVYFDMRPLILNLYTLASPSRVIFGLLLVWLGPAKTLGQNENEIIFQNPPSLCTSSRILARLLLGCKRTNGATFSPRFTTASPMCGKILCILYPLGIGNFKFVHVECLESW